MSMDRSFDPVSDEAIAVIVARSKQDTARYEALRQCRFAEAKAARLAGLLSRCERASPASCCSNPPLPRGNSSARFRHGARDRGRRRPFHARFVDALRRIAAELCILGDRTVGGTAELTFFADLFGTPQQNYRKESAKRLSKNDIVRLLKSYTKSR